MTPQPKKETFARIVVVGRAVRLLRSNEMLTMMTIAASSLTLPTWTTSTMTAPKVSGHATAVDLRTGNVLVFAGLTGSAGSPCTNDLWSFDGTAWQKLDTIGEGPGPRMYSAAATLGQNLYVFGGWDPEAPGSGGTFKDDVWKLHLPTLTWTQLDPMPCGPVSRHVACTVGETVVVHTFRGVLTLDGASGILHEQPTSGEAPSAISMCAASSLGDSAMMIFGGSSKTQQMSSDVYVLDTSSWEWRRLHTAQDEGQPVPTPRASSCAAPAGGSSCVIFGGAGLGGGGYNGGAGLVASDETWRVTVDGNVASWELLKPKGEVPHARVAASLCPLPSGGFLLQGGWDPASKETFGATSVLGI